MQAEELAECGELRHWLGLLGEHLDDFLRFDRPDPQQVTQLWKEPLEQKLPIEGVGMKQLVAEMGQVVIPNGAQISHPGFSSYITTGPTTSATIAMVAGAIAAPQRIGLHAFNLLEELSLRWLLELFGLSPSMQGVYTSGGSVANLIALGAARQWAYKKLGLDAASDGISLGGKVLASAECHHSVLRACAVLGLGRNALVKIECDVEGRICADKLDDYIGKCNEPVIAIVGNLGSTNAGAIDPVSDLVEIAQAHDVWLHLDGAYGLPGILDPQVKRFYQKIEQATSVSVDPHKWLGAPVGVGVVFVNDKEVLQRAFTQEPAAYLEGSECRKEAQHSLDQLGTPYSEFGVELSAPCRGAIVWAILREIGVNGMQARIVRHNAMARKLAHRVLNTPALELLRTPMLSICCFRYTSKHISDLDKFNIELHRRLIHNSQHMPSTTIINGCVAIRPCFIGARTSESEVDGLIEEVLQVGSELLNDATWLSASQTTQERDNYVKSLSEHS